MLFFSRRFAKVQLRTKRRFNRMEERVLYFFFLYFLITYNAFKSFFFLYVFKYCNVNLRNIIVWLFWLIDFAFSNLTIDRSYRVIRSNARTFKGQCDFVHLRSGICVIETSVNSNFFNDLHFTLQEKCFFFFLSILLH